MEVQGIQQNVVCERPEQEKPFPTRTHLRVLAIACFCAFSVGRCGAQITFSEAVHLAVQNSPRMKAAENDLKKAHEGLAVARDMYIPSVVIGGGVGDAYGITLTVPTIFTVSTQSLVFSSQQRDYVRGARFDIQAAKQALEEVQQQVEEDAAITYISLQAAEETSAALNEQEGFAGKLSAIMRDRLQAGLESDLELKKYRRGHLQIKLARMQADDNVEDLRGHLAQLTGLSSDAVQLVPGSIPQFATGGGSLRVEDSSSGTPGLLAAELNAKARQERAKGDAAYVWRPQVGFGAAYGRISPIQNVSDYYNLHNNYNTASFGFSVQFPILDRVRKAAAEQSKLDAQRAAMDLESLRGDATAGRRKLERSVPELMIKAELADVNYDIAQDELAAAEEQSHHATGAPLVTPKEVINAHIEERQRYVEMLAARLESRKAQITYHRLSGQLDEWIRASVTPSSAAR